MKIDIHTHTRKIKTGDPDTRNIEAKAFSEIIKNTDVKILAITNHNHFDLTQFEAFRDSVSSHCQIWPGVELDIFEEKKAHLLVIANPKNALEFNKRVDELLSGKNADSFTINLKETVAAFDDLDCLYVAHYKGKSPSLDDNRIDDLAGMVSNPKRILKEAANSISAGIYISHGHNSIYGSDIQDWSNYVAQSKDLPELRLPVESYDQFCLLLEKDEATINTILNKKIKEAIELRPFNAAELIKIDIYNDINILFGSKGTGKTDILKAISKYYNSIGHKTEVYISNDIHLNDYFDIKGINFNADVTDFAIDDCEDEINFIKQVKEEEITSLAKYAIHFSIEETNKISQKIKIKDILVEDEGLSVREFQNVKTILDAFNGFKKYLNENNELVDHIPIELISELSAVLEKIIGILINKTENKFFDAKSIEFLNKIIRTFIDELAKKTNKPPKPTKTGFATYASNRIKIECFTKKILENIRRKITPTSEYAGSLGIKGDIYCQTNLVIQNGNFTNGDYKTVKGNKKTPQKDFVIKIVSISKHIYATELFEKINELNEIESIESIRCISDLLLFHKHFVLDGNVYSPSNGESSMILLHKELTVDKDIYLIDEPEKSLGNDYISDVIVPLLKEKAMLGKKVVLATHDANIAVRTLPYNSVYRLHDKGQYFTMTGNPFSDTLKCILNSRPPINWKEISMKTLEGGRNAFGERGKIYGN